jgi:uncharacterized membrane protein
MFRAPPWGGLIIPAVMLVVVSLVITAPFMVEEGSVDLGDDGVVGGSEHSDEISELDVPLARAVYSAGDIWCHQKEARTLVIHGNPMPVCARDLGLFAGMLLGSLFAAVYRGRFSFPVFGALVAPMVIDGSVQLFADYESVNPVRLVTGFAAGIAIAWMLNCALMFVSGDYPNAR